MKTKYLLMNIVLISTLLLTSCGAARVDALQTESKSVELGEQRSFHLSIEYDQLLAKQGILDDQIRTGTSQV